MSGNMINETDNDGRDLRETVAISAGMWYKRDRECARCLPGTCSLQEVITMKKIIATTNAPAAIGPYSQAIDCGSFLVTSGQVPFDPATGKITEIQLYKDLPKSAKIRGWIYSVHAGTWGGLTTRILSCLVSLLGAVFAITGYYFWIKKKLWKSKQR